MKIGVLGGTFDPVHKGHTYMAEKCLELLRLDKIMFLPNGNPPHKKARHITDKIHRYNMLSIAISSYDRFFVSDYEIVKDDYSYTVETMRYMRSMAEDDYTLIIGADSFYQLSFWYSFPDLIKENNFAVVDREYDGHTGIEKDIMNFNREYSSSVELCRMPLVNISSTDIRERLIKGLDVSDMVDENVIKYIRDNKLYR